MKAPLLAVVPFLALSASAVFAGTLATTPFRIEWSPPGSTMSLKLQDIDKTEVKIDVPTMVEIESVGGQVRQPHGKWTDQIRINLQAGKVVPPILLRNTTLWPQEIALIATITPSGGQTVSSRTTVSLQPVWYAALLAAMLGAVLWTIIDLVRNGSRTLGKWVGSLALALPVALIAWAAAKVDFFWKLIGVNSDNFVLQTYLLLGACLAYRGIPWALARLTGEAETKPLTATEVKNEVVSVLQSDAVRKPVREELQDVLFSTDYLSRYPETLPQVETALIEAKYGATAEGLSDFLRPRLDDIYTASHRENVRTNLDVVVRREAFLWHETTAYDFVRNPNDPSNRAEIRYAHVGDVPLSLRALGGERIESIGSMVTEMEVHVHTDADGELTYRGSSGKSLQLGQCPNGCKAAPVIELALKYDKLEQYLSFGYELDLPEPYRSSSRISIRSSVRWLGTAEDGIYSVRFGRLTRGYQLAYRFSPPPKDDHVRFEWRPLREQYDEQERLPGIIDLPGWLVPGNGVCLSYNGTEKSLATSAG